MTIKMKVLITNTVILNGGDAAILLSIIKIIQDNFGSNIQLIVYDSQPEIAYKYYPNIYFMRQLYAELTSIPSLTFLDGKSSILRLFRKAIRRILRTLFKINLLRFSLAALLRHRELNSLVKFFLRPCEQKILDQYYDADLIISTGGTYLTENYSSLKARIFDYKISLILKKPLIFFTQSLGPFKDPKNQTILRKIFQRSSLILLRDKNSLDNLKKIGISNSNMKISTDAAFALIDPELTKKYWHYKPDNPTLKVAISVRHWSYFNGKSEQQGMFLFRQTLSAATEHLVKHYNAQVTYISTCQGIPEYWKDDSLTALEIIADLPDSIKDAVTVDRKFHAPETLVEILKEYDFVISTRMHCAILALLAGKPVLPIAYEFKTRELFDSLGMGRWTQSISALEPDDFRNILDNFINESPSIKSNLLKVVIEQQRIASSSGSLVKEILLEHNLVP